MRNTSTKFTLFLPSTVGFSTIKVKKKTKKPHTTALKLLKIKKPSFNKAEKNLWNDNSQPVTGSSLAAQNLLTGTYPVLIERKGDGDSLCKGSA